MVWTRLRECLVWMSQHEARWSRRILAWSVVVCAVVINITVNGHSRLVCKVSKSYGCVWRVCVYTRQIHINKVHLHAQHAAHSALRQTRADIILQTRPARTPNTHTGKVNTLEAIRP